MQRRFDLLAREGRVGVTAEIGTAGVARGFNLFVGPDVGLGDLNAFSGAGNLTLVALG